MTMSLGKFLLGYGPVKKFVDGVGADVQAYFGRDKACVVGLMDDGVFYAEGLFAWLQEQGSDVVLTIMHEDGKGLEEKKISGRKVLLVDNYIISGTGYRNAINRVRALRRKLKVQDVKFAVLCDRKNVADFFVEGYAVSLMAGDDDFIRLDKVDLKILKMLSHDGRRPLAEIAASTNLTGTGVKKRLEKLIAREVLEVKGRSNISKFYALSASIMIDADVDSFARLQERLASSSLVYNLVRVYASYGLMVNIVASSLQQVDEFVDQEVRQDPGVKRFVVHIGDLPIMPRFLPRVLFDS